MGLIFHLLPTHRHTICSRCGKLAVGLKVGTWGLAPMGAPCGFWESQLLCSNRNNNNSGFSDVFESGMLEGTVWLSW